MISCITSLADRALKLSRAKGYPLLGSDPTEQMARSEAIIP
jgi:hypothetical protein